MDFFLYNIKDISFAKKYAKNMIFLVKKFAYIVDFSYLCSEIGSCTLF